MRRILASQTRNINKLFQLSARQHSLGGRDSIGVRSVSTATAEREGVDLPLLVLVSMVPEEGRRGLVLVSLSGVIGATCDQLSFDRRGRSGQHKRSTAKPCRDAALRQRRLVPPENLLAVRL